MSTAFSKKTVVHRTIVRRLAGLGAAGLFAATGLSAGLDASTAAAAPTQMTATSTLVTAGPREPVYEGINQFQGQPTQAVDCGPTSAVIAMRAEGYVPQGWAGGPRQAIETARAQTGITGPTVEAHMLAILQAQSVPARADTDFTGALDEVRAGKSAIISGKMNALPYVYDYRAAQGTNPDIVHAVVVTDHDSTSNTYRLLDPNGAGVDHRVTYAQLETYQASLPAAVQHQTVVG